MTSCRDRACHVDGCRSAPGPRGVEPDYGVTDVGGTAARHRLPWPRLCDGLSATADALPLRRRCRRRRLRPGMTAHERTHLRRAGADGGTGADAVVGVAKPTVPRARSACDGSASTTNPAPSLPSTGSTSRCPRYRSIGDRVWRIGAVGRWAPNRGRHLTLAGRIAENGTVGVDLRSGVVRTNPRPVGTSGRRGHRSPRRRPPALLGRVAEDAVVGGANVIDAISRRRFAAGVTRLGSPPSLAPRRRRGQRRRGGGRGRRRRPARCRWRSLARHRHGEVSVASGRARTQPEPRRRGRFPRRESWPRKRRRPTFRPGRCSRRR